MKNFVNWLKNEESGQGMVEYGMLIALIAVGVIAALIVLGPQIKSIFTGVSDQITSNGVA
ncbi:MAG: Flp family type IVb pilin [Oscillospiraceae bacterium]